MFNHWGITPTKKLAQDITLWRQNRFPAPLLLFARGCDRSPCGDLLAPPLFPLPELQTGSVGPHSYFLQARCVPIEPGYGPARQSTQLLTNQTPSAQFASLSEISWVAEAMPTWSRLFIC